MLLSSGLAITYNTNGIATLSYNGATLINSANGDGFQANRYYTLNSGRGTYTGVYAGNNFSSSWNSSTDTLTYNYPAFGSISVQYVQVGSDRLNMVFTVRNTTSNVTLGGVDLYPARVHFPDPIQQSAPGQWFPLINSGIDGPGIIPAGYSGGSNDASMALVNDNDPAKPMYLSLWTLDNTTGKNYFIWAGTGPKDAPPSSEPIFYRQTGPGQSDSFEISLRFGATGTDPYSLASDIESNYAAAYPDTVNWPDRRAIAALHLTSPPTHPKNPEGWFNNSPTTDTTTTAGIQQFCSDLLTYATNSIKEMQKDNSQGMIVWDVEGQRWVQPTTYIGDPALMDDTRIQLNQEMEYNYNGNGAIVDQFFAMFRNAGLRVGLTIRPQQVVFDPTTGQASQQDADEVTELERKISYALNRWGCTLFYIDSNSGIDRDQLATVQAAYPNVFLMPEHSTTSTYASTAPYGQLSGHNFTGTPGSAIGTYPNATLSVIYPADGDSGNASLPTDYNAIEQSVARGDIILFRGWFADPYNATMVNMYDQAVPSLPATPAGLGATPSNGAVKLSWSAVTGTGIYGGGAYNVKRGSSAAGPFTTIAYGVFGPGYTDTSVTNNTTYYYVVSALNGRGEGSNSTAISATPSFAVLDGSSTLQVTGTASADNFSISQTGSTITVKLGASQKTFRRVSGVNRS